MKLSIILVAFNMERELPRTLMSLTRDYQLETEDLEYEVLVIDNGSSSALDAELVCSFGPQFKCHFIDNAPSSPAYALNYGVRHSSGDILCFMIDGAHILTPGVVNLALLAFRAFDDPIVMTRYFYLGPGEQNDTILQGYTRQVEDELLQKIGWPKDGYRLFEIGAPLQGDVPKITWFNKMIESNCLFIRREVFDAIGGAEERFDIPGGGMLNMDLYREASKVPGTLPVLLVGEGSFHQLHGGTTTNVDPADRDKKVRLYENQYREIRGGDFCISEKIPFYLGHLPTKCSKIHQRN